MAYISSDKYYKVLTHMVTDGDYCSEDCPFVDWYRNYCKLFCEVTLKNKRCHECRNATKGLKDESNIIDLTNLDKHLQWFKFYLNREKDENGVSLERIDFILEHVDSMIESNLIKDGE